ncbi:hypothetical protein [Marinibacterium sp. SX1]|uniref:hypothetical protein n=1 Tax=Marinibacterium sp. SX1 TaxID=3388424 RepID=UPI003D1712A1
MVQTNKILTVSYGTFSCTLEGFDDAFGTMKAIAEYFRDLAADDRYFGAEPPQPDADMLARIAQTEISRRVDAHTDGTGILLRATAPAIGQDAPGQAAERPAAEAAPQPATVSTAQPAPDKPQVTLRSSDADADAAQEIDAAELAEAEELAAELAQDMSPAAPTMMPAPDNLAAKLARIRAVVDRAEAAAAERPETTPDVGAGLAQDAADLAQDSQDEAIYTAAAETIDPDEDTLGAVNAALATEPADMAQEDGATGMPADAPVVQDVPVAPMQSFAPEMAQDQAVDQTAGIDESMGPDATQDVTFETPVQPMDSFVPNAPVMDAPAADTFASQDTYASQDGAAQDDFAAQDVAQDTFAPQDTFIPRQDPAPQDAPAPQDDALMAFDTGLPAADPIQDSNVAPFAPLAQPEAPGDMDAVQDAWARDWADDQAQQGDATGQADTDWDASGDMADDTAATDMDQDETVLDNLADEDVAHEDEAHEDTPSQDASAPLILQGAPVADEEEGDDDDISALLDKLDRVAETPAAPQADAPAAAAEDDTNVFSGLDWDAETDDGDDDADDEAIRNILGDLGPRDTVAPAAPAAPVTRVIKVKRADLEQAIASGSLEEIRPDAETRTEAAADTPADAPRSRSSLSDEDEADLQAELDAVAAELAEAQAALNPPDEDAPLPAIRRERSTAVVDRKEPEVSRLMAEADHQMDEPESSSRREAYSHLRAAVAAAEAEDALDDGTPDTRAPADAAYREDLANVVRPRRAELAPPARPRRPLIEARPAPLKLVAEQRVDADTILPQRGPIRPRRIAAEDQPDAGAAQAGGFVAFAREVGAQDLHELLEAAAAYLSFVEGREQFSRPQLMTRVKQVETAGFNREDGLRTFGQLLREGKIEKTSGGRFTASEQIGFRPSGPVAHKADKAAG